MNDLLNSSIACAGDKKDRIWPKTQNVGVFNALDANSIAILCYCVSHDRFLDLLIPLEHFSVASDNYNSDIKKFEFW